MFFHLNAIKLMHKNGRKNIYKIHLAFGKNQIKISY